MTRIAVTRDVSPAIERCELVHQERRPIDVTRARRQHGLYEEALTALGCRVEALPADPELADSVFVEDTAIVLDEVAVITRPGAESRRPETAAVSGALAPYRPLLVIEAPGTLDGGDVLRIGRTLYVGLSGRSDQTGIDQLSRALAPYRYEVRGVAVHGCLHLKSAVTALGDDTVLVNREWVDPAVFTGTRSIEIDPRERGAANALRIGERVIYPASFPATRRRLALAGIDVLEVDVSELQKAEGAVTCCSLVFEAQ
ncbi:MAG TPA: arginine deiminase family protein [Gemmatimonadales bacterium]|nr:arginine deiminase family protein [Gemmatimonadales bacterium]